MKETGMISPANLLMKIVKSVTGELGLMRLLVKLSGIDNELFDTRTTLSSIGS